MSELFKEAKEVAEVKPATKKDARMIEVVTLVELPAFRGKRIPKGTSLKIPAEAFNEKLMSKK